MSEITKYLTETKFGKILFPFIILGSIYIFAMCFDYIFDYKYYEVFDLGPEGYKYVRVSEVYYEELERLGLQRDKEKYLGTKSKIIFALFIIIVVSLAQIYKGRKQNK